MKQAPTHGVAMSEAALGEAKQQLDNAAYQLMLEEVDYDTKCLSAYLSNVASFELRMQHQKDTWTKRRVDRAKEASNLGFEGHMPRKKQNQYVSSFNLPLPICQIGIFCWHAPG